MSINMNRLFNDGPKGVWPYAFDRDDYDKHRKCLRLAKEQGLDSWVIEDYDLVNYHAKPSDNHTKYIKLNDRYRDLILQEDITSIVTFNDPHKDTTKEAIVRGLSRWLGKPDAALDTPLINFYRNYISYVQDWLTLERAIAVLDAICFGSNGVEMVKGDRLDLTHLLQLISIGSGKLTRLNDPLSAGGFRSIWDVTLREEHVYSRLRDYRSFKESKSVHTKLKPDSTRPTMYPVYDGRTDVWSHAVGLFSVDDWAVSNALMILTQLRSLNVKVDLHVNENQLIIANASVKSRPDTSYLC